MDRNSKHLSGLNQAEMMDERIVLRVRRDELRQNPGRVLFTQSVSRPAA